jgi:hypothetical protein
VEAVYQFKFGLVAPEFDEIVPVGTPTPHCVLLFAVGAAGNGFIITVLVVAVFIQPVVAFVAVTVYA